MMTPADMIILLAIVLIIGGAIAYIIHAKKSGKKCIGCPDSCSCGSKKQSKQGGGCGGCGRGCQSGKKE